MGFGMEITNQAQAREILNSFNNTALGIRSGVKNAAVVMGTNGNSISVSKTDKPGFLGALFRSKADVQVNKDTRATFLSALKMLLNVSSDKDLEAKLGADTLKLSDFNDNKGHPLSAYRILTILCKVSNELVNPMPSEVEVEPETVPEEEDIEEPIDLGLGPREAQEDIRANSHWEEITTKRFVDDASSEINDAGKWQKADVVKDAFSKLTTFFTKPRNAKGFNMPAGSIKDINETFMKRLEWNLKQFDAPMALSQMINQMRNVPTGYHRYLINIMEQVKANIAD